MELPARLMRTIIVKYLSDTLTHYWGRARDFCVYKVLHADDPPHRLALGVAVGMFVTFMPLIGLQMFLSVFVAWLVRANKLVGIPLVWISNPLTVVPIYYPCYLLGCRLLGTPAVSDDWNRMVDGWKQIQADQAATWWSKLEYGMQSILHVAGPLSVGCLVVGLTVGVLSYYVSLFAIRNYRLRRWGQLMPPSLTPAEPESLATVVEHHKPAPQKSNGNAA